MLKNRHIELLWSNIKKVDRVETKAEKILLPSLGMSLSNLRLYTDKKYYTSSAILDLLGYWNCYLWWDSYEGKQDNLCFLLFYPTRYSMSNYFPPFVDYLKSLNTYKNVISVDIGTIVVILRTDPKWGNIKQYVEKSKYSYLGSKFAGNYFNPNEEIHQIIVKSRARREQIEEKLGVLLPEGAELLDCIDKEQETLKIKYEFT